VDDLIDRCASGVLEMTSDPRGYGGDDEASLDSIADAVSVAPSWAPRDDPEEGSSAGRPGCSALAPVPGAVVSMSWPAGRRC